MTPLIVFPPRAGTGLRHAVNDATGRAWCGRNVDGYYTDRARRNERVEATIGCKQCRAAWAKARGRPAS